MRGLERRTTCGALVTGNRLFASAFTGSAPAADPVTADTVNDQYEHSIADLADAFRQPGSLDSPVEVPVGTVPGRLAVNLRITELLSHGWDLDRAPGLDQAWPNEVVEHAIGFTGPALARVPSDRSPFAPPTLTSPDASSIDRLATLPGRGV